MTEAWLGLDWRVISIVVTLMTVIIAGMLGLIYKLIVSNFDARTKLSDQQVAAATKEFSGLVEKNSALVEERLRTMNEEIERARIRKNDLEKDFRSLLTSLPAEYVHRDDWIRGFNQIDGKIDNFAQKTDARLEAIWEVVSKTRVPAKEGR